MAVVLVTDGTERSALAVVRSLGRAGHSVFVGSTRRRSLAGSSRYCRGSAVVPNPIDAPEAFADAIAKLIAEWKVEVIIPISEPSLHAILPNRARFTGVTIPFPDYQQFCAISDKDRVTVVADSLGIAIPQQHRLMHRQDLDRLSGQPLEFPLVIKPIRSVSLDPNGRIKLGVSHCGDRAELLARLNALPDSGFPVLLQKRIVGPGMGVFLLLWKGKLLASFMHRRIREKPPSGGVSVVSESIPLEPALVNSSEALLKEFNWQGVAMVEYKLDKVTGRPYLMEVNGRFWGSLQLAIDSGVDFPALLVKAARGETVQPVLRYRTGVRSRWLWGDVDQLLTRLRRPAGALALPPDAPGRTRAFMQFLWSFGPRDRAEILRAADLAPFLRESIDWVLRR